MSLHQALKFQENGYLFDGNSNTPHELSKQNMEDLIQLSKEELNFQAEMESLAKQREKMDSRYEIYFDLLGMPNINGVITQMPYGDRIITFPSTRHFYRGEKQIYPSSLPSLRRKIDSKSPEEKEIYAAIAHLKVIRFGNFIWNLDIVPYWDMYMSNINEKALAQHYGFETFLLDLTNDFMVALFFATCKYNWEKDCYEPLSNQDINQNEDTKYGVIFHAPNWRLDWNNVEANLKLMDKLVFEGQEIRGFPIDSGVYDEIAFKIGYQPFYRCSYQSGYVYPLKHGQALQENPVFEKLRFKQSEEFSHYIFELMDEGRKIYPNEGIGLLREQLKKIQETMEFTLDDIKEVYEEEVDKNLFSNLEVFMDKLLQYEIEGKKVKIVEQIDYDINSPEFQQVNQMYDFEKVKGILKKEKGV